MIIRTAYLYLICVAIIFFGCDSNKNEIIKYPSGEVKIIWTYKKDTLNGLKQIFWKNGKRNSILLYRNGKPSGSFKTFYMNGFIASKGDFNDGKLHGHYYKYFESDSGKVMSDEYIMNPNEGHYYFYSKRYNEVGGLVEYKRFLIIELNENVAEKSAIFKYVGDEQYDSMKIVSGTFSIEFKALSKIDTTDFQNNIAIVPFEKLGIDSGRYIRGKIFGYKSTKRGDTVTLHTNTRYYEQKLDDLNKMGTEIKLGNDSLYSLLPIRVNCRELFM